MSLRKNLSFRGPEVDDPEILVLGAGAGYDVLLALHNGASKVVGVELIRVAVPFEKSAKALPILKSEMSVPLIADIHFDSRMAILGILLAIPIVLFEGDNPMDIPAFLERHEMSVSWLPSVWPGAILLLVVMYALYRAARGKSRS